MTSVSIQSITLNPNPIKSSVCSERLSVFSIIRARGVMHGHKWLSKLPYTDSSFRHHRQCCQGRQLTRVWDTANVRRGSLTYTAFYTNTINTMLRLSNTVVFFKAYLHLFRHLWHFSHYQFICYSLENGNNI